MSNYYGKIDLTRLGQIIKAHPERIKRVQFKDGEHQLIDINVREKARDNYDNVAYINVGVRSADRKEGVNYFIADLKASQYEGEGQKQANPPQQAAPCSFFDEIGTNVPPQPQTDPQSKLPF